jgi:hypothetical protein
MADVFLSYAKEDRTQAKLVYQLLNACDWSVFWDEHIETGADWRQTLDAELAQARVVVVLWSRSSVVSDWVKEEADLARERGVLLTVLIDRVAPPLGFGKLQAIDLIRWQGGRTDGVDRLREAVSEMLHATLKPGAKVPPPPPWRKLLAGGLLLVLLAAYPVAKWLWPPAPLMNQEIVVDASEGMDSNFDDQKHTKLTAAVEALRTRDLHPDDNLALRVFGGECNQANGSNLLVSFGTNHGNRIVRAAEGIKKPRGKSTLVMGLVSALSDLRGLQHAMRIVVLTGHADQCFTDAVRDIKGRIDAYRQEGHPLELEVRLVGMGVSTEDQSRLQAISDAVGAQVYFVNTIAQLNDVLGHVLEFEPAMSQVKELGTLMDTIGHAMSKAADYMNQHQYDSAQRALDSAGEIYAKTTAQFERLAARQVTVNIGQFYKLATESRPLQQQAMSLGREIVRLGKASTEPTPAYNASVQSWNGVIDKYNSNINEMNRLSEEIANEAQKSMRTTDSSGP